MPWGFGRARTVQRSNRRGSVSTPPVARRAKPHRAKSYRAEFYRAEPDRAEFDRAKLREFCFRTELIGDPRGPSDDITRAPDNVGGPRSSQIKRQASLVTKVELSARVAVGGASGFLGAIGIVLDRSVLDRVVILRLTMPRLCESGCCKNGNAESSQQNLRIDRVHFKFSVFLVARLS